MFNVSIFFFFQSILLVTLIFWILSILGEKFFKSNHQDSSSEVFECGFFSVSKLRLQFNFSFFILGLLLLIYDIEFFLLIPFFLNIYAIDFLTFWYLFMFITSLAFSFLYDWQNIFYTNWMN